MTFYTTLLDIASDIPKESAGRGFYWWEILLLILLVAAAGLIIFLRLRVWLRHDKDFISTIKTAKDYDDEDDEEY